MTIISHSHKFIYIKTRKTASTSIQVLLGRNCGKNDILTPINPVTSNEIVLYNKLAKKHKGFISHMSAKQIKKKVGNKIWNQYFKFTFERNPWDKLVSQYHKKSKQNFENYLKILRKKNSVRIINYKLYEIRSKFAALLSSIRKSRLRRIYILISKFYHIFKIKPNLSFEQWIQSLEQNPYILPYNHPLYTIKNKVAVDFIGKFENLEEDLKYILSKLNLPMTKLTKEKSTYRTIRNDYRNYYNNETKRLIEQNFKKEIELFGYDF